jgi:hypothetical protein
MELNKKEKIFKVKCETCNNNIFSYFLNKYCLNCQIIVDGESIEIKNPIEEVRPKSIIITKSFGELNAKSYDSSNILHMGISNSKCKVYNFWFNYKIEEPDKGIWKNVININLDSLPEPLQVDDIFDMVLDDNITEQKANNLHYDQFNNNCYSYICRFLNSINYNSTEWTKENFAVAVIEPKIMLLENYCSLVKKLEESKIDELIGERIIIEKSNIQYTISCCDGCSKRIIIGERNRCLTCKDFDLCDDCFNTKGHEHKMSKM